MAREWTGSGFSWAKAAVFCVLAASLFAFGPVRAEGLSSLNPDNDLVEALEDKDRQKFQLALQGNIRPTVRDAAGVPVIILAVESRDVFFVSTLLEQGARPDDRPRRNRDDRTALTRAVELGEAGMVRVLLDHDADPDLAGAQGEPALIKAAHLGHDDIVRVLIEGGADLEITEMTGRTPIEVAERSGHFHIADMLRAAGTE